MDDFVARTTMELTSGETVDFQEFLMELLEQPHSLQIWKLPSRNNVSPDSIHVT